MWRNASSLSASVNVSDGDNSTPQTYTVLVNHSAIGRAADSNISENLMGGAVAGIVDRGRYPK